MRKYFRGIWYEIMTISAFITFEAMSFVIELAFLFSVVGGLKGS
jgi:hypothetical protein